MLYKLLSALVLTSVISSCVKNAESINKFSDPALQRIAEFQDRRMSDSLYRFLAHEDPLYRKEAALAFASIQDTMAIHHLAKLLLWEKDSTVRNCVAFAIGQTPSQESERIILAAITKERNPFVLSELFEAYGKATTHWQHVKPAFFHDSVRAEGLAWSIYRAGVNGKTDSTANRIAGSLLNKDYKATTRLGAAHFFARSATNFSRQFDVVRRAALSDPSVEVRMACTYALRKINTGETLATLKNIFKEESDYRVRVNAVRAMESFGFIETRDELFNALNDKQVNVAVAASEVIRTVAKYDHWIDIANRINGVTNWRVRATLYQAAIKAVRNEAIFDEIKSLYDQSRNVYERSALLTALQSYVPAFEFLREEFNKSETPVIYSAAAAAIAKLNYEENFTVKDKAEFVSVVHQAVARGDAPSIGTLASALADPKLNYKEVVKDVSFLKTASNRMSRPRDNESIEQVEKAIGYFEGAAPVKTQSAFNHPIDWSFVNTIPKDQKVLIKTSKGHIKLRLFVEEAPGSVSNFLKLVRAKYFDKKLFHRVVPNFVIQAGCKRGDGSGSEDYSIRSEFSHRRYTTGSVGMASSGKDTEGTQWFITHSPTPHLDGRYTIFAEVIDGMQVVHNIEVGDEIITIEMLKK
jgi:cyclophilin family peptidyl-prolyl cis-trans isomerase/HEAT repeat protein